jgi:esterase/lipase superfamily enzyme
VLHAAASAPLFARFVEFLATHTDAQYVNILAYSAGAQVASPGLAILRETHRDTDVGQVKERLRIAEAYFAAPDVEFRRFATHDLPAFMPLVGRATMTLFLDDAVLGISEWHHGTSRAGSPNLDELGPEETEWLLDAAITPDFDVIDMGLAGAPALTDSHGYWYNNPWVSSDVLFQFIYHVGPGLRGLVPLSVEDPVWYFPEDYPETVFEALRRIREASGEIAPAP